MAKVNASQLSFNRGEISKLALARVDVEKTRLSAECQVNWLPSVLGPMMLRPGSKYLGSTRSDAKSKIIPFVFSNDDTALVEVTASHVRVWVDDALLTVASVSTAITSGDFSSSSGWTLSAAPGGAAAISGGLLALSSAGGGGTSYAEQTVTVASGDRNVVHRLRIVVQHGPVTLQIGSSSGGEQYWPKSSLGSGTHSIAFTPTADFYLRFSSGSATVKTVDSVTVESAGTFDLPGPWGVDDLAFLRWAQSADIIYVACDGFQPRQIERRDNNSWSVVLFEPVGGPFTAPPEWAKNISMGATISSPTTAHIAVVSASENFFDATKHVGALFRINVTTNQNRLETLAGVNATSRPFRITGVTSTDRFFSFIIAGTWAGTITLQRSVDGPDSGFVGTSTTYTTNGTYTLDDSADYTNIDAWYRFTFLDSGYTSGEADIGIVVSGSDPDSSKGFLRVREIINAAQANADWFDVPSSSSSKDWQISEWNDGDGWPSTITFFDGRLWLAGDDRLWGSVSDDFTNFNDETLGDSGPIARSINSGPIAITNFLLPLTRLIVGCEASEVSVRSSAFDEPLTPINFTLKDCSTIGSANMPALKLDTRGVFVEKSNRRVYELRYDTYSQDYVARDLTHMNPDIGGGQGFVTTAVSRQPETVMHFPRGDGQVACLVQSIGDEVDCWWRIMTLGVVEDVAVLPGNLEDSVYYVVKRTINGSTKRFLEKFAMRSQCQGGSLSRNLDCHTVVSQASSTTITGLSYLEGETVGVWANGKDLGSYTVSSGSITVSEAVTTAIVGLGYVSFTYDNATAAASVTCASKYNGYPAEVFADDKYVGTVAISGGVATLPNGRTAQKIVAYLGLVAPFRSAKLAYGAQMGTALNQPKQIERMGLMMLNTHYQGVQYGSSIHDMQPLPLVENGQDTAADTVWSEYDEPMIGLAGSWDTDSRMHLLATAPRPAMVAGVVIGVNTTEAP